MIAYVIGGILFGMFCGWHIGYAAGLEDRSHPLPTTTEGQER